MSRPSRRTARGGPHRNRRRARAQVACRTASKGRPGRPRLARSRRTDTGRRGGTAAVATAARVARPAAARPSEPMAHARRAKWRPSRVRPRTPSLTNCDRRPRRSGSSAGTSRPSWLPPRSTSSSTRPPSPAPTQAKMSAPSPGHAKARTPPSLRRASCAIKWTVPACVSSAPRPTSTASSAATHATCWLSGNGRPHRHARAGGQRGRDAAAGEGVRVRTPGGRPAGRSRAGATPRHDGPDPEHAWEPALKALERAVHDAPELEPPLPGWQGLDQRQQQDRVHRRAGLMRKRRLTAASRQSSTGSAKTVSPSPLWRW